MGAGPLIVLSDQEREALFALYTRTLNGDLRIRCLMVLLASRATYTLQDIAEVTLFGEDSVEEAIRRYRVQRLDGLRGLSRPLAEIIGGEDEPAVARTYQYQVLLGASRQRLRDSEALLASRRYNGAIYVGCYAVECIVKCRLCQREGQQNFLATRISERFRGTRGHDLRGLLDAEGPILERIRKVDRNGRLSQSFQTVYRLSGHMFYRYNEADGKREDAEMIVPSIRSVYEYFVNLLP